MIGRAFAAVLVVMTGVVSTDAQEPAAPVSQVNAETLQWTEQRARQVYGLDRAAWIGTDVMLAAIDDLADAGFEGYIAGQGDGEALNVIFYGPGEGGGPHAKFIVEIGPGNEARIIHSLEDAPIPLDAVTSGAVAARKLAFDAAVAREHGISFCTPKMFNTVVLPGLEPEAYDVYLLTPLGDDGGIPFGGHYKVSVESGEITHVRPFTNSCIALNPQPPKEGANPAALMLTHVLDDSPTEIHLFQQVYAGVPLYVMTGPTVWEVNDMTIRLVSVGDETETDAH